MPRTLMKVKLGLLEESGYSKRAIELYTNRVNMGALRNPDIIETYTGPCGDVIRLCLKVNKNCVIEGAKFHYLGCPGSAASTSAMIELAKGKTLEQAKKMTEKDVIKELGGLPEPKLDCAKLAIKTLQKAIVDYEKKRDHIDM
jgi:NifU-like protein involved in Fe-S cluster formation